MLKYKTYYNINKFKLFDWLTIGYVSIWIALILVFHQRITSSVTFLALHIGVLFSIILLAGLTPTTTILKIVRRWYQFMLVPLFFAALHYLIPALHPGNIDFELIRIDYLILGTHPTVWFEKFHHQWMTEILQISYLGFYILGFAVAIPLYIQNKIAEYDRLAFSILLTFYLSYIGYLAFPALGPRFFLAHLQNFPISGSSVYSAVSHALNDLENIQWDAFPSGHIAITLIFSRFLFLYLRRTFYITLPLVILLVISTVYLRYHYLVDILAGFLLYGMVTWIDRRIYCP
ncbi:MAG: phosphatase PAP2 family protein [bacterium]|nr:MAG: phosphatase PAP2 family protein [bacterium]